MVKSIVKYILQALLVTLLCGCSRHIENATEIISAVKEHFVPDSRTGVFNIEVRKGAGNFILGGETDNGKALQALLDSLDRIGISYENMVELLPEEEPAGRIWALTNVSVSNIRKEPRHSSELVTQGILGTPAKVLKKQGGWYLIQTPDRYLGWVNGGGITLKTVHEIRDFHDRRKVIFTGIYGFAYQEPDVSSRIVSDLTLGNVLCLEESEGEFYKVVYPDGRHAFISKAESMVFDHWVKQVSLSGEELKGTAFRLLGIPYLWGGTSAKAMDCSGFTKIVYQMHGLVLSRDASQQEEAGMLVDERGDFEKLEAGDLLFFGRAETDSMDEHIVHVGMWIGNMEFIHASGDVHVSSMDMQSSIFDEYNLDRYLRTKRIIGSENSGLQQVQKVYSDIW